jgi:hypothetical protein
MSDSNSKKAKGYLLEFLMIFLAVTLGFFAESYRESLADKRHERQLIQSFIEDLKSDTTSIRVALELRNTKLQIIDSLMLILESQQIKGHEKELYYYGRVLIRSNWFQSNDRTISQLNNSGSSALIQNQQVMDSIIAYQKIVKRLVTNHEDERTERYNTFPVISKMFNAFVFDKMVSAKGINRPSGNPPLRSYDVENQQDLAYCMHQLKGSSYLINMRLELLDTKARNLIKLMEEEYELK